MLYYNFELIPILSQFSPALVQLLPAKGDQWELVSSHFKIGAKLGEGNYGQVYKGTLSMKVATLPAKTYIYSKADNEWEAAIHGGSETSERWAQYNDCFKTYRLAARIHFV